MSENTIELKELMILASYKALSEFDTSDLTYHLNDSEGLIDEIVTQFSKQFKENLISYYDIEVEKLISHPVYGHQDLT